MNAATDLGTVSVCIATHDRPDMLRLTLDGLRAQSLAPLDLVVSDSSAGASAMAVVEEAASAMPGVRVRHLRSPRRSLPWQRWWASREVGGDVVLFLDDDVVLRGDALERLLAAYADAAAVGWDEPVAGIGFVETVDGRAPEAQGAARGIRERWLRLASLSPGSMTAGGITVALPAPETGGLVRVCWLWGGGMSYPRTVLSRIGLLDELGALYERQLGKGEDAVLSVQASRHGALFVLAEPLARHLEPSAHTPRANAQHGWRRGLWGTWGRAHTMRWVARDPVACRRDWTRLAILEAARSVSLAARAPWRTERWARVAGSLLGGVRSIGRWDHIPPSPASGGPGRLP